MRVTGTDRPVGASTHGPVLTTTVAVLLATVATGTTAAPAQARGGKERLDRVEKRLVRAINRERARHGLRRARPVRSLARAADHHSWDMLRGNFFAHASGNGWSPHARMTRFRRSALSGETLAYVPAGGGLGQASQVLSMWLASPPHRAVLLDGRLRRIGVARRTGRLGGARVTVFTADLQSRR